MHGKIRLARKWYTKSNHVLLNETWVGEVMRPFHCNLSQKSLPLPHSWQNSSSGFRKHWAHTSLKKDGQPAARKSEFCCLCVWPRWDFRKETRVLSTKSLADESLHSLHVIIFSWGTAAIFPSLPEIYAKLQNIFKYHLPLISPFFQNFPAISAVQQAKEL